MGCRHYFVVDRLEDLFDEGGSRSSWRAHEHESFQLVSQLHVAIRMFWSRSSLPLNALIGSKQRVSLFCHLFNFWAWHRHWMGINPTQIFPFSSLTVAWCCCSRWGRRAWRRCRTIILLPWRCHWCWRMRTGGRTRSQDWNDDRNEVLRIALYSNPVFYEMWFSTPFSSQSFPTDNTAGVFSRTVTVKNISNSLTYTVASSCVCTSLLAFMTVVGLHDFVKVSISAEFVSCFADYMHRRAGVGKLSFLRFLKVDASRHLFSEGEKNVALFFSLNFLHTFGQPPRCFAGTLLLPLCLFLRPILKFWSVGATLIRFPWAYQSKRRILVSNVCVTCNGFLEFYTLDRFPYVWALP